ncbi:PHP domain-containing protein [Patescibacteria group bacterium]|nr:PHP domain-containing protein [Patescibacteria group bacterium]
MLKCSLHIHTTEEPYHVLFYNAHELIDEAKKHNFDVLAFTSHDFLFFPKEITDYATKKDIILLPGIEKKIEKKHVVIINATPETENINNFKDLQNYKTKNPNTFIFAAHPYYPGSTNYKNLLKENLKSFDAIELCHYYTKNFFNYNKKAEQLAKKEGKHMIATSDVHIFDQLNKSYILLNCEKNPQQILKALKKGNYQNISNPLSPFDFFKISMGVLVITQIPSHIKQIYYRMFPKRRKKGIIYRENIANFAKQNRGATSSKIPKKTKNAKLPARNQKKGPKKPR